MTVRTIQSGRLSGNGVTLPWVERAAELLLRSGPTAIGLRERDRDEALVILRCAVELLAQRRPGASRTTYLSVDGGAEESQ